MNLKRKGKLKQNLIFIIVYIISFISFFYLQNYYDKQNIVSLESGNITAPSLKSEGIVLNYFSNKREMSLEIDKLKKELELEKLRYLDLKNYIFEIDKNWKEEEKDLKIISAKKIFTDYTTIYSTALLNKGIRDGVSEGDLVFLYPDKAIGIISRVKNKTSQVSMFSKDKNKIEGILKIKIEENLLKELENIENIEEIENQPIVSTFQNNKESITSSFAIKSSDQIIVDLYGYGGGDFIMTIPKNIEVETGMEIYMANYEDKVLGSIVKIEKPEASYYQVVLIKGYYNTRENNIYYILKNN